MPSPRAHTFDSLAPDVIEYARKHAQFVTVERGAMLTRQGDPASRYFVVQEGYVKLVSTSAEGTDVMVGIAGPNDAFGHAAVAERPRDYVVTGCALSAVTAASWARETAMAIAEEFPDVHRRLNAQLMVNFELVLSRLHLVVEGTVPERLARALLELAERHGVPEPPGIAIAPPLTRQDMAAMVGSTLFSTSRVLAEWEQKGLIASKRAKIVVRSLEGLRLLAGTD